MVCRNVCHAYLLVVGIVQIPTDMKHYDYDYQIIVYHVGIHVDISSMISCWTP
jgi:hypothetical protein